MKIPTLVKFAGSVLLLVLAAGCSSVKIHKIGDDGKITGPEGLRYYLPRPYVWVYEPFVLGSDAYLVQGFVNVKGNFVRLDTRELPAGLTQHFAQSSDKNEPTQTASINLNHLSQYPKQPLDETSGLAIREGPSYGKNPETEPTEDTEDPDDGKKGKLSIKVSSDNAAFAVIPGKRFFDIIFLPDFDEQYIVTAKGRFGSADIGMLYGQGWSLQSLGAMLDNSAVVDRTLKFYDGSMQALINYSSGQVGAVLTKGLVDSISGGLQSATPPGPGKKAAEDSSQYRIPITLKVHVVKMATPGLYPILKPSEIERVKSDVIPENQTLTDYEMVRGTTPPLPPFTNIVYNSYEVVVVDAVIPFGDSTSSLTGPYKVKPGAAPLSHQKVSTDYTDTVQDYTQDIIKMLKNTELVSKIESIILSAADSFAAPVKLDVQVTPKLGSSRISKSEKTEIVNAVIRAVSEIPELNQFGPVTAEEIQIIVL